MIKALGDFSQFLQANPIYSTINRLETLGAFLYLYGLVVTVRTASFLKFRKSTISSQDAFMCSAYFSEQTMITYLDNMNLSVSIAVTERVYCAARTESSNIIYFNLIFEILNNSDLNNS